MYEIETMPMLPGADKREMKKVDQIELKNVGVTSNAFALHEGDQITFNSEEPVVVSQQIRKDSDAVAYYVACTRNGENSWLGVGNLTRRDINGKYLCATREKLGRYPNFASMYKDALQGHTLTAGTAVEKTFAVFENNQVIEGKTRTRFECPITLK